jgi:hypothetical protein
MEAPEIGRDSESDFREAAPRAIRAQLKSIEVIENAATERTEGGMNTMPRVFVDSQALPFKIALDPGRSGETKVAYRICFPKNLSVVVGKRYD